MVEKLSFTVDPLFLIRFILQTHVEKNVQGKYYKAKQYAHYDYLFNQLSEDEAVENLITEYAKKYNLTEITFANSEDVAKKMWEIITERDDYKRLEVDHKCKGHGKTGLGVFDKSDYTFYDCGFTKHWETIINIVEEKYPHYSAPLENFYRFPEIKEYKGVTREEVEEFIMENFKLIGEQKNLREYI